MHGHVTAATLQIGTTCGFDLGGAHRTGVVVDVDRAGVAIRYVTAGGYRKVWMSWRSVARGVVTS